MDQDLYELPMTEAEKAQVTLDMNIKSAFDALDEIMAMGADPKTRELVLRDLKMLEGIEFRLQMIGSAIKVARAMREQPGLRMVVNHG